MEELKERRRLKQEKEEEERLRKEREGQDEKDEFKPPVSEVFWKSLSTQTSSKINVEIFNLFHSIPFSRCSSCMLCEDMGQNYFT